MASLDLKSGDVAGRRKARHHEHVYTRRSMTERIRHGEDPAIVFADAHGCVVTTQEHHPLMPFDLTLEGWERYRAANIRVIDTDTGDRII